MDILNVKLWLLKNEIENQMEADKARRARIVEAINSSKYRYNWDYKGLAYNKAAGRNTDATQLDWNQTLLTKINEANKDFKGTSIICSCEVGAVIDSLEFFEYDTEPSEDKPTSSFYKLGILRTLYGTFDVIVDVYMPAPILIIVRDDFFTAEKPECAVIYVQGVFYEHTETGD